LRFSRTTTRLPNTTVLLCWLALGGGAGCGADLPAGPLGWDPHIVAVEAVVSEHVGTVVTIRWETAGPTRGYVEYGTDPDYGEVRYFPETPSAMHDLPLLGLHSSTEYHYRVVVTVDGEAATHATGTFETGSQPAEVLDAGMITETQVEELASGGFLAFPLISNAAIPVIVDGEGNPVWWHIDEEPHQLITMVALAPDGQSVFYNSIHYDPGDGVPAEDERILRVSLDGTDVSYLEVPRHSHSFQVHDDGTVSYLAYDPRGVDGELIRGDRIVEIRPDGSTEFIWSVWDHFEFDPEAVYDEGTGWTHANALVYEPDGDAYYISLRNYSCILKIDRQTGEVIWTLGGTESDFEFVVGSPFAKQHEFDLVDGGIVVFDNGQLEDMSSRVIEYVLDEDQGTASGSWGYVTSPPIYVSMGGGVVRLADGNTLITWSSAGRIDLVDPEGTRVWGLATSLGTAVGFSNWYPSLYVD
jgi:hypothetical protein